MMWRNLRAKLRRDPIKSGMKRFLDSLDYDFHHFSLASFLGWAALRAQQDQKRLVLVPRPLLPAIFGAWVRSDTREVIFFDEGMPLALRTHTLFHEVSHWLLDHSTYHYSELELDDLLEAPHQDVPNRLLAVGLKRSVLRDEQETQAETLALLMEQAIWGARRGREVVDDRLDAFYRAMDLY